MIHGDDPVKSKMLAEMQSIFTLAAWKMINDINGDDPVK